MYSQMYMAEEELSVLHKFVEMADKQIACELDDDEKKILHSIISDDTKPKSDKGVFAK
ncbi:MAG: hypothetical protein KIC77_09850 [Clostridiales bacterium]|nr:hypothetical protein [Clostridiales bacterium]